MKKTSITLSILLSSVLLILLACSRSEPDATLRQTATIDPVEVAVASTATAIVAQITQTAPTVAAVEPAPTPSPTAEPPEEPAPIQIPTATPRQEAIAATPSEPFATPQPELTATSSPAPTVGPLSSEEIYERVSPAVAIVKTFAKQGSGTLIDGGYVITTADVVWPFHEADLIFPNGETHYAVGIAGWDLVANLALVGPIDTSVMPAIFAEESDVAIGGEAYLLGHVSTKDVAPEALISRGIVTRFRHWDAINMTYIQTDIRMQSGQSGAPLVSDTGEILGIVGHTIEGDNYALASSVTGVNVRIATLKSGEGDAAAEAHQVQEEGGSLEFDFSVSQNTPTMYVFDNAAGTGFEFELSSESRIMATLIDANGDSAVRNASCMESVTISGTSKIGGPHYLTVFGCSQSDVVHLAGNVAMLPYNDKDEMQVISIGDTLIGNLNFQSDTDRFEMVLAEGETVEFRIETLNFVPSLTVGFPNAFRNTQLRSQFDSASSVANGRKLTFRAPMIGNYEIGVSGTGGRGGYTLTAAKATEENRASTFQPSNFSNPIYPTEQTEAEKDAVQVAMETMMEKAGVTAVETHDNSVQSWSYFPAGEEAEPLYPTHLEIKNTRYFYCWDTDGKITYQYSQYIVCPPPQPKPGAPYNGMRDPRASHSATLLDDGRILVVGGDGENYGSITAVEIYDPETKEWKSVGSISQARSSHTATVLEDGNVLITGGIDRDIVFATSELYDPSADIWSDTKNMSSARFFHTTVRLGDGTVLVSGGVDELDQIQATGEIYAPKSNKWTDAGLMSLPRALHSATVLRNGNVLVTGGLHSPGTFSPSAELFDSSSGTWTEAESMNQTRGLHTDTLLSNGKVLVTGGMGGGSLNPTAMSSAELYDPVKDSWQTISSMNKRRADHTATLLSNGRVLVVGGFDAAFSSVNSAEIYDPESDEWTEVDNLTDARSGQTSTPLDHGQVIVIGGKSRFGSSQSSTEIYSTISRSWNYIKGFDLNSRNRTAAAPVPAAPAPAAPSPAFQPREAETRLAPTLRVVP